MGLYCLQESLIRLQYFLLMDVDFYYLCLTVLQYQRSGIRVRI
jgi:hypothetical protein